LPTRGEQERICAKFVRRLNPSRYLDPDYHTLDYLFMCACGAGLHIWALDQDLFEQELMRAGFRLWHTRDDITYVNVARSASRLRRYDQQIADWMPWIYATVKEAQSTD
jgi:hypothetical protein